MSVAVAVAVTVAVPGVLGAHKALLDEHVQHDAGVLFRSVLQRLDGDLRVLGRFVRVVDTGEADDLAAAGAGLETLGVALLSHF